MRKFANQNKLEAEIAKLEQEIHDTSRRKQEIFSTKEKEKIIKNHELKKEMALKLEEAKASLEKQKFMETEVTSKMSILQNYHLSLELENFAAKISEQLAENTSLQESINSISREVEIQKMAEMEFSQIENETKKKIVDLTGKNSSYISYLRDVKRELEEKEQGFLISSERSD